MLCSYDYPLSKLPALCQRWVKKFLCSDLYLAPSSFLFPNCLFACFPLVWPWQSCNPTSSANVVPSFLALFLFCLLSSRWPNPCPHCLRCRIEWHRNQNFDRFLNFFLFFYDITRMLREAVLVLFGRIVKVIFPAKTMLLYKMQMKWRQSSTNFIWFLMASW